MALGARLLAAACVPRAFSLFAAARWRARAAGGGGDAGGGAGGECAAGFGFERDGSGARALDCLLFRAWQASAPARERDAGVGDDAAAGAWMAAMPAATLCLLLGTAGKLRLAEAYEAAAEKFGELEDSLEEEFERDEAPAARLAAARAVAEHFGCSNLSCTRTAGLSRADAKVLFPPKRCSRCMVLRYCGAECQAADWRAGHNDVCRALAAERENGSAAIAE